MGRPMKDFYAPRQFRPDPVTQSSPTNFEPHSIERPRKWVEAPFDPDEDLRDGFVYEAFLNENDSETTLGLATAVLVNLDEPMEVGVRGGFPTGSGTAVTVQQPEGSDCPPRDMEQETSDDMDMEQSRPLTPSSGVFHPNTLPLALPTHHERARSHRSPSPRPSSSTVHSAAGGNSLSPPPDVPPPSFHLLPPSRLPARRLSAAGVDTFRLTTGPGPWPDDDALPIEAVSPLAAVLFESSGAEQDSLQPVESLRTMAERLSGYHHSQIDVSQPDDAATTPSTYPILARTRGDSVADR